MYENWNDALSKIVDLENEEILRQAAAAEEAEVKRQVIAAENKAAFKREWKEFWEKVKAQVPAELRPFAVLPDPDVDITQRLQLGWTNLALAFSVPGHEDVEARFKHDVAADSWVLDHWEVYPLTIEFNEAEGRATVEKSKIGASGFSLDGWVRALLFAKKLFNEQRGELEEKAAQRNQPWSMPAPAPIHEAATNKLRDAILAVVAEGKDRP
jgi:hypothetical protein